MSYGEIANKIIENDQSDNINVLSDIIFRAIVKEGAHDYVANDWANEVHRRAAIKARVAAKKENKLSIGRKGEEERRILKIETQPKGGSALEKEFKALGIHSREFKLHATKGMRVYRVYN